MTVNFKPYVFDQVRHTWCMLASPEDETFIVNLSNANAADVLAALGLSAADENNPMPIDAFSNLTTAALRRHLDNRSPERELIVDPVPGKMTIIHCSRREGYVEERLGDLAKLIQRSRTAGSSHIGWG